MPQDQTFFMIPVKWLWLLEIAIGILIVFAISLSLKKIVSLVRKYVTDKEKKGWKRKIHKIFHMPLQVAVWGFGLAYVVDVIATHYGLETVAKYARPLRSAFIISCVGWILLRWMKEGFAHLTKKSEQIGVAPATLYALSKLSSFTLSILILLIIFQIFGFNVLPLLAFGGIGVAGVAFATKDIIANFFNGMMLHFTGIFSIGDEIVIPSKENFQGVIKEMGWYITVVEDYYRRPVYFPNSLFSTVHVVNESRRTHRRIKETISLRYEDLPNIEKIIEELKEKIGSHPEVDETQSFSITFDKFGTYGIDIYFYVLVFRMKYVKFLRVKQEILLIMQDVVSKHNAEFCYPTTNVNLKQLPTSLPREL